MAKKPRKQRGAVDAWALALIALKVIVVLTLTSVITGVVIYKIGLCPGVIVAGVALLLCGSVWLGLITYAEFSEDDAYLGPLGKMSLILVNGFLNFRQCLPQLTMMAIGLLSVVAGIAGWILLSQIDPELNQKINPKFELKEKEPRRPFP